MPTPDATSSHWNTTIFKTSISRFPGLSDGAEPGLRTAARALDFAEREYDGNCAAWS